MCTWVYQISRHVVNIYLQNIYITLYSMPITHKYRKAQHATVAEEKKEATLITKWPLSINLYSPLPADLAIHTSGPATTPASHEDRAGQRLDREHGPLGRRCALPVQTGHPHSWLQTGRFGHGNTDELQQGMFHRLSS